MHSHNRGEIWLCLGGGNALGAYHAGAYRALHETRTSIGRISGASIGAIIGAIIAGNRYEDRLERLDEFWRVASETYTIANVYPHWPTTKIAASLGTLVFGRPGVFHPAPGQWLRRLFGLDSPSLFDRGDLRKTLNRLIDFDRLNGGEIRLLANAVDVRTGEEIVFDSDADTLTADHLMATSAFPVLYSPETVGERTFADGGLASNLPILPLFREIPARPITCLAFDLVSPQGSIPSSLDESLRRAQELLLSIQSKRTLQLLRSDFDKHAASARLLHVFYHGKGEVGGMTMEYSAYSMRKRYEAGYRDGIRSMEWMAREPVQQGLTIDWLGDDARTEHEGSQPGTTPGRQVYSEDRLSPQTKSRRAPAVC